MSRLDYAPGRKEIQITDIKAGRGVFVPKPDKPVSFASLKSGLKKAGYELASATIIVSGKLAKDGEQWSIVTTSGQRFVIVDSAEALLKDAAVGESVEVSGDWKAEKDAEVITLRSVKKVAFFKPRFELMALQWAGD